MSISCPQCGGSELRQITPGFFECVSQVQVGAIPPGVHGNREHLPVPGPCGHRFQVGGSGGPAEPCHCGRDSIGACRDCSRRLCGLHGTNEGEFLCAECIGKRRDRADLERRERYEEVVSVVRVCEPIAESRPADTSGPRPDPPLGQPLPSSGRGLGEHSFWQKLWADGETKGFANLVGITWNERFGKDEGECWQVVHHHVHVRQGMRQVRRALLPDRWVAGMHPVHDCWTAYAFWPETGRLCDIQLFSGSELSDHWTRLVSRAGGSILHDLRWAAPIEPAELTPGSPRPVRLDDDGSLFAQLERDAKALGLETWIGLGWVDYQGRHCRVVDDAMVQANRGGLPAAYRAILIDKADKDGVTIDREVIRAEAVDKRFDEIGRELGSSLQKGEFAWTVDSA